MSSMRSTPLRMTVLLRVTMLVVLACASFTHSQDLGGLEALFGALGGMQQGGTGRGQQPQICPAGEFPAPTENPRYRFRANGCGPEGMEPIQEPYGLTQCCHVHDVCYGICGTTHKACETDFTKCMKKVCQQSDDEKKCQETANGFSGMTAAFGSGFHQSGMKEACQCYKSQDAQRARWKDFFLSFYQRRKDQLPDPAHATVEHVESLLETKKNKGKEGEVFFRLMKKYGMASEVQYNTNGNKPSGEL